MLTRELNDLLTQTGAEKPMGRLIRRYWIPALLSEEIPEPDSPPVQVRIMGEELVAFRDSRGRVGLLNEHCSHRGTSLFYGRNENCGLACIYHGWKYDVDGNVMETPAEPATSTFKEKIHHPAYPTHEAGGIVWAYLGPAPQVPLFPNYTWTQLPKENVYVAKSMLECNYLQGLEGECDSSHLSFLHRQFGGRGRQELYAQDTSPAYEVEETDFGMRLIATRKTVDGDSYVRISSFVMPVGCWVPAMNTEFHMYVPIDDTHTWRYDLGFLRDRAATPRDNHRLTQIGPDYRRLKNARNGYMQDRQLQKSADYTGIEDFLNEDAAATESMGPIFDRTRERLGLSDRAVIAVRHYLINAVKAHENGAEPPHIVSEFGDSNDMRHIDAFAAVVPAGEDWRTRFPHLRAGPPSDLGKRELSTPEGALA